MKKDIQIALVWAALVLLVSLAAKVAHQKGYIDSDMVLRVIAMNGLMMVYYGNLIPKKVAPSTCARQAQRVSGWSLVLSGLVYAGLWAFAPIPVATVVGTAVVFAGVVLTLSYCVWLDARTRSKA